jgi:hypothetical protein
MSLESDLLKNEIDRAARDLRDNSVELESRLRDSLMTLAHTNPMLLLGGSIAAGLIVGRALNSPVLAAWLHTVDRDSLPR